MRFWPQHGRQNEDFRHFPCFFGAFWPLHGHQNDVPGPVFVIFPGVLGDSGPNMVAKTMIFVILPVFLAHSGPYMVTKTMNFVIFHGFSGQCGPLSMSGHAVPGPVFVIFPLFSEHSGSPFNVGACCRPLARPFQCWAHAHAAWRSRIHPFQCRKTRRHVPTLKGGGGIAAVFMAFSSWGWAIAGLNPGSSNGMPRH